MGEDGQEQLAVMIAEISTKMQVLLDKQDELGENISKIKEAVYNPDQGIYARLRSLETWKNTSSKITCKSGSRCNRSVAKRILERKK